MIPYYKSNNCKMYNCDNMELLKNIPDRYIDLIYCDILYGTGKNFGDYLDLKTDRKTIESHYIPRITEMKRVLKDDGSIYLQMDYRIIHWVRCLMDDVFGYGNFVNEIIWCYTRPSRVSNSFSRVHNNILFYSKTKKRKFNKDNIYLPYSEETISRSHRKSGKKSSMGNKEGLDRLNDKGKVPEDWWLIPIIQGNGKERKGYATQKPKKLIERIILASSNPEDIVADFYMGSGSTAEQALSLGRKFIGCDISEKGCGLAKERVLQYE